VGANKRRMIVAWDPPPGPIPPDPERTVLLDQFGTGTTWGYTRDEDNRLCSGEIEDGRKDEQSSSDITWRNRLRR
jgi:hypothetical protein